MVYFDGCNKLFMGQQSIRQAASPWGYNPRNIKKIDVNAFSSTLQTRIEIKNIVMVITIVDITKL